MTTAGDLIGNALQELKVYAPGESIDDADYASGLKQLNLLLDFLSNDSAACFANLEQSFPLVVGTQSYTIGTGGAFNGPRPLRLIYGPGAARVEDSNHVTVNLDVWPQDRWNQIGYKTENADYPSVIFYDPQFPLGIINVFPIPTQAWTLFFDSYLRLANLSSYTSTINLPPGYEPMLQHNLTVWLKPFWKSAQLDPIIEKLALRTLTMVKRTNKRQNIAEYDPELLQTSQGAYDINTDSYGSRT
jgi:hypothetical protein